MVLVVALDVVSEQTRANGPDRRAEQADVHADLGGQIVLALGAPIGLIAKTRHCRVAAMPTAIETSVSPRCCPRRARFIA